MRRVRPTAVFTLLAPELRGDPCRGLAMLGATGGLSSRDPPEMAGMHATHAPVIDLAAVGQVR